eukprot:GGOE01041690.1.p1 GENE.GGOE01041690.1~~GGOE01041690.1.p1  ORF type:complete len:553 (-),score=170.58 GGOE01041690.1:155-1813(-)
MQFTPQQLMGFGGYSHKTLVGNWSEDWQLKQEKLQSFVAKVQTGSLLSQAIHRKVTKHMTPMKLTPEHSDGFVHFGDRVVLQCAEHNGFLSVDLDDEQKVATQPCKVVATCAAATQPVLRNVWSVVRVPGPDDDLYPPEEVEVLHYNQPFKLELMKELCGDRPLSLYTELVSGTSWSRVSHHQEVTAVDHATAGLVWRALCSSLEFRMEMEGMPVQANVALVITHSQTNLPLCSLKAQKYLNDFGLEWEVCCFADKNPGTKQRNIPESPPNHWAFISGPREGPARETRAPQQAQGGDRRNLSRDEALRVVDKIRTKLLQKGCNGFRALSRVLNILNGNAARHLDKYELENGLQTCSIALSPAELTLLVQAFGSGPGECIDLRDFLDAVRGPLTDRRRALVEQAFQLLDVGRKGAVPFEDVRQLYDPKKHPDVLAHSKTPDQVLQEFISAWDKGSNATVTLVEFLDYYTDIGAATDSDDFFELMVRNTWHLSGGKGLASNTSCRRVVITHNDGTQSIEEIKNDLRIAPNDMAAMRQNLEAQGITDIRKFQLYS